MFDPSLVVQSAASTFNNAALVAPNFFWTALLAAPIFIAAWIFAPMIAERFLSDSKKRDFNISILAVVSIFIWTLSHQAFGALRDFSFIGILCAVILCACASFLSRRYYGEFKNLRVSKLIKNEKWKPRADAAVPAVLVAIAAFAGEHTIAGMALSGGAVAIGWLAGWMLERRGAATRDPKFIVAAMSFVLLFGLIMQPEFFRFGQLGNLTIIHLLALTIALEIFVYYFMANITRPRGWFKKPIYKKARILVGAVALLSFLLFMITESSILFGAMAIMVAIFALLWILHTPASDAGVIKSFRNSMWILSIGIFGILAVMPVLTAAAIVMWRITPSKNFLKIIRSALL